MSLDERAPFVRFRVGKGARLRLVLRFQQGAVRLATSLWGQFADGSSLGTPHVGQLERGTADTVRATLWVPETRFGVAALDAGGRRPLGRPAPC